MILACQYCGGLEAAILACAVAAWGWGAWMLGRVFWWLRKPSCTHPHRVLWRWRKNGVTLRSVWVCPDCDHQTLNTETTSTDDLTGGELDSTG